MSAFLKTLFGDAGTVAVVAVVMAAEMLLVADHQLDSAVFAVPLLVLAGTAWLAKR
jgi:type IV secretory pathway VirB2 component (pilin)